MVKSTDALDKGGGKFHTPKHLPVERSTTVNCEQRKMILIINIFKKLVYHWYTFILRNHDTISQEIWFYILYIFFQWLTLSFGRNLINFLIWKPPVGWTKCELLLMTFKQKQIGISLCINPLHYGLGGQSLSAVLIYLNWFGLVWSCWFDATRQSCDIYVTRCINTQESGGLRQKPPRKSSLSFD